MRHSWSCRSLHRHASEGSRSISEGAAHAFASAPARRPSGSGDQPHGGWALSTRRAGGLAGGGGSRSCRNAASPVKFALLPQQHYDGPQSLPRAASDGALSLRCSIPDPADSDCSTGTAARSTRCSMDGVSPVKSSGGSGSARAHSHGSLLSFCAGQRTMSAATSGRPSHDGAPASDVSEQSDREPSTFSPQPAPSSAPVPGLFGPAGRVSGSRVPSPFVPERHVRMREALSLDERRRDELESGLRSRVEEARDASEFSRAASRQLDHDLRRQSEESHHNAATASAQRRSLDSGRQQDAAAPAGGGTPSAPRPCIPTVASVSAFASHPRFAVAVEASASGDLDTNKHARAVMRRSFSHQLSGSLGFPGSPVESAPSDDDAAFGFPASPSGTGTPRGASFYPTATHERRLVRSCIGSRLARREFAWACIEHVHW